MKGRDDIDMTAESPDHKAQRWQDYKDRENDDWTYERWSNSYDSNMTRASKAHEAVNDYRKTLGWGEREVTININEDKRRLDIADVLSNRGIEHKTGYQTANKANLDELRKDQMLVEMGWEIKWVFEGTASLPLMDALKKAGIDIDFVKDSL